MYRPRLLGWEDECCYHVVSRTPGREFLFGKTEREMFGRMLERGARFCGVEVLTWCCMSNHFHLLVRVSAPAAECLRAELRVDRAKFLQHLGILYSGTEVAEIEMQLGDEERSARRHAASEFVERYLARMGDLSVFVKELKQRFAIWFNHQHGRDGTLWSARFRSVLVENSSQTLRTVAAYIDLNPVRAGLVGDPKDYRWCGYGKAMGGHPGAREGLRTILSKRADGAEDVRMKWRAIAEDYRVLLFGKAVEIRSGETVLRCGVGPQEVADVLAADGRLPVAERFRLRVRHLTEGVALGSADFLQGVVDLRPDQVGKNRKTGGRKIGDLEEENFQSLRDLAARTSGGGDELCS